MYWKLLKQIKYEFLNSQQNHARIVWSSGKQNVIEKNILIII
jgi:hypothetical protein